MSDVKTSKTNNVIAGNQTQPPSRRYSTRDATNRGSACGSSSRFASARSFDVGALRVDRAVRRRATATSRTPLAVATCKIRSLAKLDAQSLEALARVVILAQFVVVATRAAR